jgi:small subunit ribosomal protein S19
MSDIIDKTIQQVKFKNLSFQELSKLTIQEQAKYYSSRIRRSIKRGFSKYMLKTIKNILRKESPRVRSRNIIITPEFVGKTLLIYNGQKYSRLEIKPELCGHYIGEFVLTRKIVKHGKLGKGATKSSKYTPIK